MTVGQLTQITLPVIKYCGGGTPLTLLCTQFFFPPFAHAGENFSCLDTSTHHKHCGGSLRTTAGSTLRYSRVITW